ncbi:hypothetical protein C6P41_000205 [Kluyveromyces marxianus]|nr:hypothetical protein C6P41_000205 [Kluyveromyces marxianus]
MSMYKLSSMNMTHSTGSFLNSAPVELTSVKGYQDFIAKQRKLKRSVSTQLITGDAKDYLLQLSGET